MSDQYATLLPQSVLRSLSDKLYEKRKVAALEVEAAVKQLTNLAEHDKISAIIDLITKDFALSPQANHRKGGLIGLAAATVGLSSESSQHLERIVRPVLQSFSDQDSRVRYYACEALYNIAKVSRGDFIIFFNDVFEALMKLSADVDPNVQNAAHLLDRLVKDIVTESDQFSIEEFIPVLRERMNVINPFVRQFLVGWITVLDSVPDIDMIGFLPDFLDGLFNMLGDTNPEIKVQADSALKEFLLEIKNSSSVDFGRMTEILVIRANSQVEYARLIAITWLNEFVKLGGSQLIPYYAEILEAVLSCISDEQENIREVAKETNYEQVKKIDSMCLLEGLKLNDILNLTHRLLNSQSEITRIESLRWIALLLSCFRNEVLKYFENENENVSLFDKLAQMLSDPSDEVLLLILEIEANIAKEENHFKRFISILTTRFDKNRSSLLEKRGSLIFRQICLLLDPEKIYREMAKILEVENDFDFATVMVQALNLILLTAPELSKLREKVKMTLHDFEGKNFFFAIYPSWAHSPMAIISLCFLSQAYEHACCIISCLEEGNINVNFLIQIDKFVHLLETPVFAFLRLQLLEPRKYPFLLKALYGLLMILPQQSAAWKILRTRLKSVPVYAFLHISSHPSPLSPPYPSNPSTNDPPSSPQHFFACENSFTSPNSPTSHDAEIIKMVEGRDQTSLLGLEKTTVNGVVEDPNFSVGSVEKTVNVNSKVNEDFEFSNAMKYFQNLQKRHVQFRESMLQPFRKLGMNPEPHMQDESLRQKDIYPDYVEK